MAETDLPTRRSCGTMEVHERLLRTDPRYLAARARSENHAWETLESGGAGVRTGVTVIPVVVHVVFRTAAQNVSDAQILSQIDVLNRDFRMTNTDLGSIPAPFAPFAADARIEFELARTDPSGAATDGITRTRTSAVSFTDDDAVKSAATNGADAWPADRYLNVWVCQLGGGLLGYAQFPGGAAATDGVVILHSAFGTTGTAAPPFDLGRTTTHEIGHWLNLRHIWGDDGTGCSGDDFVLDTPNCAGSNTGTPAFPRVTCRNGPNGDMFMNYMDYTDDVAMFMFTAGQVARMQACLDADRPSIGHVKPAPKLKFRDDVATFKQGDDGGGGKLKVFDDVAPQTLKFRDDVATFKVADDGGTIKVVDDGPNTLKPRDDVQTMAVFDAVNPTLKFSDDPIQKLPITDEPIPKHPRMDIQDKLPAADEIGMPDLGPQILPQFGGQFGRSPFVLSTPHHSLAWSRSFPGAYQQQLAGLQAQIGQYEQALQQYRQAQAAGQLGPQDAAALAQLEAEYAQLADEYRRLAGG